MGKIRTNKKIKVFGTWAVTIYGVECLMKYYPIEKDRISIDTMEMWKRQLGEKRDGIYGYYKDFKKALNFATVYFEMKNFRLKTTIILT